jgi:hypothetical protein
LQEARHTLDTKKDKGFDLKKSRNCGHLIKEDDPDQAYIPEVEFRDHLVTLYCRGIETNILQDEYNKFSIIYSTVMTDIGSKFVTMKQVILSMFETLDQYDQELLTCGLQILFPNDDLKTSYSKECTSLKHEVVRVISVVENDLKICNNIQSDILSDSGERKTKAATAGCLPITQFREKIIHELDYVLQRYQKHIVEVLGVAHAKGKHEKGQGIWHLIKHHGQKAIQVVKRGLHKLLTFLHRNWDYVMGTVFLTVGPLVFFGIPALSAGISGFFGSISALGGVSHLGHDLFCSLLKNIPFVGYFIYKVIGGALISFFTLSAEQKKEQFGNNKWIQELEKNQKVIYENLGLNVSGVIGGVAGFVASPVVGAAVSIASASGKIIAEKGSEVAQEFKKEGWGSEILDVSMNIIRTSGKLWLIYFLQKMSTLAISLLCAGQKLYQGLFEALKESLGLSSLFKGLSIGERISKVVQNMAKELGLVSLYANTGPIRWLFEAFQIYTESKEGTPFDTIVEKILLQPEIISGFLQLVVWVLGVGTAIRGLLHYGAVPPAARNVAKMTPLLRSQIIDKNLTSLRLPVHYYTPVVIKKRKKKDGKKNVES